jgi:chromosome segregation ATPase
MAKSKSQNTDSNQKLLKLTKIMSNYITLLSPPKKLQSDIQQFLQDRAKYEEALTKQSLTIQDLQTQVSQIPQLKQTIDQLQTQNTEFKNKVAGLETTLDSLSESTSVKDLNAQLQAELEGKTQQITEITNELNLLRNVYEESSEKLQNLSTQAMELNKLRNKLTSEWNKNQDLRKTLQKERETIETLQAEKKGLEYALRRLERRLTAKGTLRGLSIPVHHLEISEDVSGKADAEIQEQIKTMNLELQKRLDRIKELEFRNNQLKAQAAQSSDQDLRRQIQKLQSELESRQGAIMGLESTRKKLMEQIEGHQQRIADLQNKIMAQGKEIEEKNKSIQNLEVAVSSGVQDQQARDVIQNLQTQNRELRNELRDGEKIIRSLEKNIKFLQEEMKNQKNQSYKLYNQTKEQAVMLHKLETALKKGGRVIDIDTAALESAKYGARMLGDEGPSLDSEIKERDRKIARLESYVENLKQEVEDLQFRMSSRDVKIDELSAILQEMKADISSSKAKIIIRPPSTDEYRKKKVKL